MDLGLGGKHAIVTGGSLGIGKAIARELAREGADVAIAARSKDQLEATARELAAETKRRIIPLVADVTSKEQVDRMVAQAAAQLGGLHILVNSGSPPGGSATATGPIESVVDDDLLHDFTQSLRRPDILKVSDDEGSSKSIDSKIFEWYNLSLRTVANIRP